MSPVVGVILLFGMVFIGAAVVAVAGVTLVDDLQSGSTSEQGERVMQQVDHDLSSEEEAIKLLENGNYEIVDEGRINVTMTNPTNGACTLLADEPMGTLRHQTNEGEIIAHQAGGIFRQSEDGSSVISDPPIRSYTDEVDGKTVNGLRISVTNLSGTAGQGTHSAKYEQKVIPSCEAKYATGVEIAIENTPYHQGWANFLESEFGEGSIDHYPEEQNVTVSASLGDNRPLESYIGVDPTIYGGLYVDELNHAIDHPITVDRYDGRKGWDGSDTANLTEDLFIAESEFNLKDDANVTGVPVTNGKLTGYEGANVTTVGYATSFANETHPNIDSFGSDNGTALYNVTGTYPAEVNGAELNSPFTEIGSINSNITESISHVENQTRAKNIDGTLSVPSDKSDVLYHIPDTADGDQIHTIDTSGGIVHVSVEQDLELSDVTVTGDGQAYFYVDENIDASNVTIEDERASGLWVYGTNHSTVDIADEFQGVLYAPGSQLTIQNDADIYGAVIGGPATIGDDVTIHFDETLRTDVPIPEANRGLDIPHPGERKKVDVMFALDRSGSMDDQGLCPIICTPGNDPDGERIDATKAFVGQMKPGDRAGAIEFNDEASVLGDPMYNHSNFDEFNESLEANADGGTYIGGGIDEALEEGYDPSRDSEKIMIVLTDGRNDGEDEDGNETREFARDADSDNVTIYTVGLGDENDIGVGLLQDIADITGGNYTHVSDASQLNELFENIGKDVQERSMTALSVSSFDSSADWSNEYAIEVRQTTVHLD